MLTSRIHQTELSELFIQIYPFTYVYTIYIAYFLFAVLAHVRSPALIFRIKMMFQIFISNFKVYKFMYIYSRNANFYFRYQYILLIYILI